MVVSDRSKGVNRGLRTQGGDRERLGACPLGEMRASACSRSAAPGPPPRPPDPACEGVGEGVGESVDRKPPRRAIPGRLGPHDKWQGPLSTCPPLAPPLALELAGAAATSHRGPSNRRRRRLSISSGLQTCPTEPIDRPLRCEVRTPGIGRPSPPGETLVAARTYSYSLLQSSPQRGRPAATATREEGAKEGRRRRECALGQQPERQPTKPRARSV